MPVDEVTSSHTDGAPAPGASHAFAPDDTRGKPAIAIIGAGQIGSRHLQALAHLGRSASIDVVNPHATSLALAESRFHDVAPDECPVTLNLHEGLDALPEFIDVAIIATNADVRLEVLRALLAKSRIKYLIVEKVLFQSGADLAEAARLLRATSTTTWVNCPKRLSPVYSELRNALAGIHPLRVHVSGTNWGIGCNSVHFLDLIQFISGHGGEPLSFTSSNLDAAFPARRAGFLEFTGSLEGRFGSGVSFSLSSYPSGRSAADAPVMISIDSPALRCVMVEDDALRGWQSEASSKWAWRPVSSEILYQSQLTQLIVRSLLDSGKCDLPPFEEAVQIHEPLLAVLNRHLHGNLAGSDTKCPIT